MVLRLVTVVLCAAAACLRPAPIVRAPEPTAVAVLLLLDEEHGQAVREVPPALADAVVAELTARNLVPRLVPATGKGLELVRDTERRLQRVREGEAAPVALLVETKAIYYSPMNGRYRWMVHARVTAVRSDRPTLSRTVDLPAFVDFEHEREAHALAVVAPALAERVGALLDELLAD